jgi:hypothetical protein
MCPIRRPCENVEITRCSVSPAEVKVHEEEIGESGEGRRRWWSRWRTLGVVVRSGRRAMGV